VKSYLKTDVGLKRASNQDAFCQATLSDVQFAVVCDGMGGHQGGNVASELAVRAFHEMLSSRLRSGLRTKELKNLISGIITRVSLLIAETAAENPDLSGMGSTVVMAVRMGEKMCIAHVGDSRCYLFRNGKLRRLTKDHSLVQMMVDRGDLTPEQARSYPGKNMITRAVGTEAAVQCDLFHLAPEWEEILLLCTDGLTNLVEDQEILFEIMYNEDRQACCRRLVDIALSRGAPDNVTCVLVKA
jgi:protein phosphatase